MDMFDQILWGPYIRILFSILNLQLQTHVFLMLSQEHLPYLIFSVGLKVVGCSGVMHVFGGVSLRGESPNPPICT